MGRLLYFPETVNDVAARLVAAGVVVMCVLTLALQTVWVLPVLAFGFVARVLWGPRVSPLALAVTRVIVPALPIAGRPVPGPPKRFAQSIGAVLTLTAVILAFGFGLETEALVPVAMVLA